MKLASKIAKLEGRKSQARIGDIREILSLLESLIAAEMVEVALRDGHDIDFNTSVSFDEMVERINKKAERAYLKMKKEMARELKAKKKP